MAAIRHMALWSQLRVPGPALLFVTVAFALVRARDQPGVDVAFGGTTATIVPGDLLLAALLVTSLVALRGRAGPILATVGALAFCALVLVTAAVNGSTALVAGVKLVELAALAVGAYAFIRTRDAAEALVDVLLLFTIAADIVGVVTFVQNGGGRQPSFLGEHDYAALATLPLVYGLVLVDERRRTGRAALAIVAGALGCILGAALASLLSLYLGATVLLIAAAVGRRLSLRTVATTMAVATLVTAGTLTLRSGELGFLQSWFGKPAERPGQYAASWSQRLIYAYVGGRVFIDHPLLGTGWYPDLPPREYVPYLDDAKQRFADQPPSYFPPTDGVFIPQQTFDQILYELGLTGALALLAYVAGTARVAISALRRRAPLAVLPAVWVAALLGALAGEGLFGGTALGGLFWLVPGASLALASVVRAR